MEGQKSFAITDAGEFVDGIIREQAPNGLYGKLIGRIHCSPHSKSAFTAADIGHQGYLFKRGSWFKTWKKRYFMLRKDIHVLCYYPSIDSHTLLGSVKLDKDTIIEYIKPSDAGGLTNVMAIRSSSTDPIENAMFIRTDDIHEIVKWTQFIVQEIFREKSELHDKFLSDDWWSALFAEATQIDPTVKIIKSKASLTKPGVPAKDSTEEAVGTRQIAQPELARPHADPEPELPVHTLPIAATEIDHDSRLASPSDVEAAVMSKAQAASIHFPDSDDEDDDDDDHEHERVPVLRRTAGGKRVSILQEPSSSDGVTSSEETQSAHPFVASAISSNTIATSFNSTFDSAAALSEGDRRGTNEGNSIFESADGVSAGDQHPPARRRQTKKPKKEKKEKQKAERVPDPPPLPHLSVDRFIMGDELVGYQLSVCLENVCTFQDKVSAVVYSGNYVAGHPVAGNSASSSARRPSVAPGVPLPPDILTSKGFLEWQLMASTEVLTVLDRPQYGRTTLENTIFHFSLLQNSFPEDGEYILVQVYKHEAYVSANQNAALLTRNNLTKLCSALFHRKALYGVNVCRIAMKVSALQTVDISNPVEEKAAATLGIVRLSSSTLKTERDCMNVAFGTPYSEVAYSFGTAFGQTLSIEQLFVSSYPVQVASALTKLFLAERRPMLHSLISMLETEEEHCARERQRFTATGILESDFENQALQAERKHESILDSLEILDNVLMDFSSVYENSCGFTSALCSGGENVPNAVIASSLGGHHLRRSVWKRVNFWQFCTINLNLHFLSSIPCTFGELTGASNSSADVERHVIPTMTLGCPAAHALKFHDGGLRRYFQHLSSDRKRLVWMQALQSSFYTETLNLLFKRHPKDAEAFFGPIVTTLSQNIESRSSRVAIITKRKFQLAKRIDMCASQALGFAIGTIKTILVMATRSHVKYQHILARSLKVGFYLCFQSMLSTHGHELGMIEDLEMAALWLQLVTVRLVEGINYDDRDNNIRDTTASRDTSVIGSVRDTATSTISRDTLTHSLGRNEIKARRDVNGRLIIDMELTPEECSEVRKALSSMKGFEYCGFQQFSNADEIAECDIFYRPLQFSLNPNIENRPGERVPEVIAVTELFGVAFNQGVNEMQTLANMSSAKDVHRQVELNQTSLQRTLEYFERHKTALHYQITNLHVGELDEKRTKELAAKQSILQKSVRALAVAVNSSDPTEPGLERSSASIKDMTSRVSEGEEPSYSTSKAILESERLMNETAAAIQIAAGAPSEKHVHVLIKTGALSRHLCGTVGILCKSGKDRTSMGVTLENAKSLVEDLGARDGMEICQMMRVHGSRRMNVYANTGQGMFAFNALQRLALPVCYRPPPNTCSSAVNS